MEELKTNENNDPSEPLNSSYKKWSFHVITQIYSFKQPARLLRLNGN